MQRFVFCIQHFCSTLQPDSIFNRQWPNSMTVTGEHYERLWCQLDQPVVVSHSCVHRRQVMAFARRSPSVRSSVTRANERAQKCLRTRVPSLGTQGVVFVDVRECGAKHDDLTRRSHRLWATTHLRTTSPTCLLPRPTRSCVSVWYRMRSTRARAACLREREHTAYGYGCDCENNQLRASTSACKKVQ